MTDVVDAPFRPRRRFRGARCTVKIRRFNPEVDCRDRTGSPSQVRVAARRSPGAQPADDDQGLSRRNADVPPLLRARGLRLGRDAHQRREPAGVQGAGAGHARRDHRGADQGPAAGEGPRRRHGAVLRGVPVDQAVPDHLRQPADTRAHPVTGRSGPLRRHDQVHPLRGVHDVLPGLLDGRLVLRTRGDRERPPLHLRFARRSRRRAPGDPERPRGCVALPHDLQLHRGHHPRGIEVTKAIGGG